MRLSAVLLARGRVAMAYPVPSLQHVVLPRKHFLGQVVFAPSPLSACLTQCTATQVGLAIGEIINAAVLERGSALVGFTGSPSLESLVSQFALHVSTSRAKTYCACAVCNRQYATLGLDEEVAWDKVCVMFCWTRVHADVDLWAFRYFFSVDEAYVPQCPERSGYT